MTFAVILLISLTGCVPEINEIFVDEATIIQDLFKSKDSVVYLYGEPHPIRLYPFGEIVKAEEERASFVIFVESYPSFSIEQQNNLLRLTSNFDLPSDSPSMFMEITQIADITVEEAERQIKSEIDLDLYELFRNDATEDFPFNSIHLYERELLWNAKIISIYIRDNGRGGVFVITTQHSEEAHLAGTRFRHYISTLEIIDK